MDEDILSEWPAWELVRITPLAVDEATARWKPSPRHESPEARPQDRKAGSLQDSDAARTRASVEKVFNGVFEGWDSTTDPASAALKTGIVGQIAAAAHGLKPLYYDAWGDKAAGIATALRGVVPEGTKIVVNGSDLLIYRDDFAARQRQRRMSFHGW